MDNLEAVTKELERFGLTRRQVDVYLLLVTHGDLRIQEIVKLSHVPRSSIYSCLRGLYELGLVEEIIEDSFKRVRAYPISVLRHTVDEEISSLQRQASNLDDLEQAIGRLVTQKSEPTSVRYYKGRTGARQLYWNTLKTNNPVYVYSEWGRQRYVGMKFYETFATENKQRNLKEKVLINLTPQILRAIRRDNVPGSPFVRTKVEDVRVIDAKVIRIKGDTMIYNDVYAQVYLRDVEIHGFEIESTSFVLTQRSIFETLWQMATPLTELL